MFNNNLPPEFYARDLLSKMELNTPPIDILKICKAFFISLHLENLDSADAIFILEKGGKYIILNSAFHGRRKRFTIAHELGHYFIPYHDKKLYKCHSNDIFGVKCNKTETEANRFAAELLMPDKIFSSDVKTNSLSLESILNLADKYDTSLSSTSIRFLNLTHEMGAIIYSDSNGKILWSAKSNSFPYSLIDHKINEFSNLHDFLYDGIDLSSEPEEVPSYAWIIEDTDTFFLEHSLPFSRLGHTLTLLIPAEEDY